MTGHAWTTLDTPVGPLSVSCSRAGVSGVRFGKPRGRAPAAPGVPDAADELLIDGMISDPATPSGLTKVGPGLLTLKQANTYQGTTYVNAGVLRIKDNLPIRVKGSTYWVNYTNIKQSCYHLKVTEEGKTQEVQVEFINQKWYLIFWVHNQYQTKAKY